MIPDTTNDAEMALIGKISVLRKARRAAAKQLRDRLIPICNSIESGAENYAVADIVGIVSEIEQLTQLIDQLG
jgi:hypothetical protein